MHVIIEVASQRIYFASCPTITKLIMIFFYSTLTENVDHFVTYMLTLELMK